MRPSRAGTGRVRLRHAGARLSSSGRLGVPALLAGLLLGACGGASSGEAGDTAMEGAADTAAEGADGSPGARSDRITRRRLGEGVNTPYPELLPIVLASGDTLYFTRAHYPDPTFRALIEAKFDEHVEECRSFDPAAIESRAREGGAELAEEVGELLAGLSLDCDRAEAIKERELYNFDRSPHPHQVYMSVRRPDGSWSESVRLPPPLNDETVSNVGNTSIASATPDRHTLLVLGDFLFGEEPADHCGEMDVASFFGTGRAECLPLAIVRRERDAWVRGHRLPSEPLEPRFVVSGGALAPDGSAIVLAAGFDTDRTNEYRGLWVTRRDEESEVWSAPVELASLNGEFHNLAPFLGPDGRSLYFASDRPGGQGGLDLYVSRRQGDGWLSWSEPENLGPDVNTEADEVSMSVDASGRYAFMASGEDGQLDIYEFHLPPNLSPAPTAIVGGRIFGLLGTLEEDTLRIGEGEGGDLLLLGGGGPGGGGGAGGAGGAGAGAGGVAGAGGAGGPSVLFFRLSDGMLAGRAGFAAGTGSFETRLPTGARYSAYVTAPGFAGIGDVVDLTHARPDGRLDLDLAVAPLEVGAEIRLNNVFFDSDSASLRPESRAELERLRLTLRGHPEMRIEIAGHTDSQRSDEYNLSLSERRAAAVRAYLEAAGVDPARLQSRGYGESRPVASNETPEGRQRNRRVAFRILEM